MTQHGGTMPPEKIFQLVIVIQGKYSAFMEQYPQSFRYFIFVFFNSVGKQVYLIAPTNVILRTGAFIDSPNFHL